MRVVYVEKLDVLSLATIVLRGYAVRRIFFFEIGASGHACMVLLKAMRILRTRPELVDFTLGTLTNERGENQILKIKDDFRRISFEVCDYEIVRSEFFQRLTSTFDLESLRFFFSKSVGEEIQNTVIYLYVARQHFLRLGSAGSSCVFLIEREFWSARLCRLAAARGFEAFDYSAGINRLLYSFYGRLLREIGIGLRLYIRAFIRMLRINKSAMKKVSEGRVTPVSRTDEKQPCLAAWYAGQMITFDLDKRSAIFWLLKGSLPRTQVMLYFSRADVPLSDTDAGILKQEGIGYVALNAAARQSALTPLWLPGKRYKHSIAVLMRNLLGALVQAVRRGQFPPFFLICNMVYFLQQYAYWFDFFESHNVKINLSAYDFSKWYGPKNLALRRCGGVSVSYQFANLWLSSVDSGFCSDVLFAFGPEYRRFFKESGSTVKQLIYNGYPTDYSFTETLQHGLALRRELEGRGVTFVICFLDDNSSDNRLAMISNDDSARTYQFFIKKVLADPTLGLVCKPGYPRTLRRRLSSIAALLDAALATKRCVFLDSGTYLSDKYPSEAAQAADVCVGLLFGGTAGMESYLAGTPTVFLNETKSYAHPLYEIDKGRVVFDDINDLYCNIEKFRVAPDSVPGFGDLSAWLPGRVAFRDGNAAGRMGAYLGWLLEELKKGRMREEAISIANERFSNQWGAENIEAL